ncbi:hypothetical protein N1226_000968 [Escherichia coli]|nr:hypothetical protein [Escherichia coli]
MAIEIIAQSKSGKTVMYGTEEGRAITTLGTIDGSNPVKGGRYLVEYGSHLLMVSKVDGREIMIPRKEYFDSRIEAMNFFLFQERHELFVEAKDAGLDDATAELIAEGKMSLEEALGDMDCDAEAHYIEYSAYQNECEDDPEDDGFDPDLHGGEDDNTPSLEVIMAGGQAAWEWQNEKNAWLDSHL